MGVKGRQEDSGRGVLSWWRQQPPPMGLENAGSQTHPWPLQGRHCPGLHCPHAPSKPSRPRVSTCVCAGPRCAEEQCGLRLQESEGCSLLQECLPMLLPVLPLWAQWLQRHSPGSPGNCTRSTWPPTQALKGCVFMAVSLPLLSLLIQGLNPRPSH